MIEEIVQKVKRRFPDVEFDEAEIKKRLELLLYEFKIPPAEAERTIVHYVSKIYNVQPQVVAKEVKVDSTSS